MGATAITASAAVATATAASTAAEATHTAASPTAYASIAATAWRLACLGALRTSAWHRGAATLLLQPQ